ncbi:zinc finger protein 37 isoform X2 [Magallana gigas]|uniref:zinc finger protein 37 isoform X2 n=1 Tax=Magallana gigas TaxID=29159 RepID=UPI003341BBB4
MFGFRVFGLLSAEIKIIPALTEEEIQKVVEGSGITLLKQVESDSYTVHGSWKSLQRARDILEKFTVKPETSAADKNGSSEIPVTTKCDEGVDSRESDEGNESLDDKRGDSSDMNDECEASPSMEEQMETEMEENPDKEKVFKCKECKEEHQSLSQLTEHNQKAHNLFTCDICLKTYAKKRYVQQHRKRHTQEKKFQCSICGFKFFEQSKLKSHLEIHKPVTERELPYKCSICMKQFHNRTGWTEHMNTHTGQKPHKCSICGAEFAHSSALKRHEASHEPNHPIKCDFCEKKFRYPDKLKAHMILHTGEKKYACQCGKIYTTSNSLKRHQQTCSDANPLTQQVSVYMYQNPVLQDIVYMCGLCEKQFDSLESAGSHICSCCQ